MAASISAISRSGSSLRIASRVSPAASKSKISLTRILIPRMHGLPPHCFGFTVILSSNSMLNIFSKIRLLQVSSQHLQFQLLRLPVLHKSHQNLLRNRLPPFSNFTTSTYSLHANPPRHPLPLHRRLRLRKFLRPLQKSKRLALGKLLDHRRIIFMADRSAH